MNYKITMPHIDRVICSDEFCEIIFEVEINEIESFVWRKLCKFIRDEKKELKSEMANLTKWLAEKFPTRVVVIDES